MFQSTLPRGERQILPAGSGRLYSFNPRSRVGSDLYKQNHFKKLNVSIHAPAWGATGQGMSFPDLGVVSIHAPAWGATGAHWARNNPPSFNPRSRVGSDSLGLLMLRSYPLFQSTLPRGERLADAEDYGYAVCGFNPRSRVGSDSILATKSGTPEVSIHAPAWGATGASAPRLPRGEFQSTLPRGERLTATDYIVDGKWFQSTLPRGERLISK